MSAAQLPVTAEWFAVTEVGDRITRITEPHVRPLLRANFWHVHGRDRDLIVDCGLGVASVRAALPWLFSHDPVLVLTHAHLDHMGSAHEFDDRWAHPSEPITTPGRGSLHGPNPCAPARTTTGRPTASRHPHHGPTGPVVRSGRLPAHPGDGDEVFA